MSVGLSAWVALVASIAALLVLDLRLAGRRHGAVPAREAAGWTIAWTAIGLAVAGLLWAAYDGGAAGAYLGGYLLERTLSLDNVLAFAVILGTLGVPADQERRLLGLGIGAALLLRLGFIAGGAALLAAFAWTTYVLAAVLFASGIRLARGGPAHAAPGEAATVRALRRFLPVTDGFRGARLLVHEDGRRQATPLLLALAAVAAADVVFAVDSVPAIFAVTEVPFLVVAANAFALLGLRPLYFLLASGLRELRYLQPALALTLVLVGAKLALHAVVEVPVWASTGAVALVLAVAVAASLRWPRRAHIPARHPLPERMPS